MLQVNCRLVWFSPILISEWDSIDVSHTLAFLNLFRSSIRENFLEAVPRASRFLSGTDAVINHTQIVASLGPVP